MLKEGVRNILYRGRGGGVGDPPPAKNVDFLYPACPEKRFLLKLPSLSTGSNEIIMKKEKKGDFFSFFSFVS